jgi:ssDNA-binding Zn-finger/Zn-ribbon topoisomerase 1
MGDLLRARCHACGHQVELLAGFGFEGVELEPRVCLDCRELVSVAVADRLQRPDPPPELNQCPDCGGRNLQPFSQELLAGDESAPSVRSGPCPSCGAAVNLSSAGTWD